MCFWRVWSDILYCWLNLSISFVRFLTAYLFPLIFILLFSFLLDLFPEITFIFPSLKWPPFLKFFLHSPQLNQTLSFDFSHIGQCFLSRGKNSIFNNLLDIFTYQYHRHSKSIHPQMNSASFQLLILLPFPTSTS